MKIPRATTRTRRISFLAAVGLVPATGLLAQARDAVFDASRAFVSDTTLFERFDVTPADRSKLSDAVDAGALQSDSWLVVMDHGPRPLALVMDQMAYHHVAQGDLMGEPWMVSF